MPADPRDIYVWQAVYANGTILNQYNEDGSKNRYQDIDRIDLSQFRLLRIPDGSPVITIHLDNEKRLIWRMRVARRLKSGAEFRVHLVGWQEKRSGINVQTICAVFPDGRIEVVDRFKENHPWLYNIAFLPEEQV